MLTSRIVAAVLFVGTAALFPYAAQAQTWQQVWADEFNWSGGIDPNKWAFEVGGSGWGNNELQFYTRNRPENCRVELFPGKKKDGRLIIEARKEAFEGKNYTSTRLLSVPNWTYGRMEIRTKLPGGRGTWPAIWMLPIAQKYGTAYWPDNGEIDIMEQVGYDHNRIHASLHTLAFNFKNNTQRTSMIQVSDPATNWHTYILEWLPHEIRIFVDGNQYFMAPRNGQDWQGWPFDKPFGFRLNVAVGGNWGGQKGVDDTIFPRQMEVDYVRVSKMTSAPYKKAVELPGRIEAENFDNGGEGFAFHDTDTTNEGNAYRETGVDVQAITDGAPGYGVGWIAADEWLTYTVNVKQAGTYDFQFRVACPDNAKSFYVELDDQRLLPDTNAANTGAWTNWQTVTVPGIALPAGQHKLRFVSRTGGFNINWIEVSPAQGSGSK